MVEQMIVWSFLLLMPWRFEVAVTEEELSQSREELRVEVLRIAEETSGYRQKLTGRGL